MRAPGLLLKSTGRIPDELMKINAIVRIVLVDDHRVVLDGLKRLLNDCPDMSVVGQASSHAQALVVVQEHRPDLVILDIRLPGVDGFETCCQVKKQLPETKVLMLTSVVDDTMILEAIRSGADGYLLKEVDADELATAIRKVAAGGILFDPSATCGIIRQIDQRRGAGAGFAHLTARERNLLRSVAEGKTNRQIANEFDLNEGTVRNYMSVIFEKMGVARRSQAVAQYIKSSPPAA
jgi:DNA-binding NarL/FixJ family response regulator